MIKVGSLKQPASKVLVSFVFGCIFISIILLFILVKFESVSEKFSLNSSISSY